MNKTIGPIISFIIDKTPLKGLVNGISERIQAALGVDELKKKVSGALNAALESLQAPLTTALTNADKTSTLLDTVSFENLFLQS